jgi:hypothetical protein
MISMSGFMDVFSKASIGGNSIVCLQYDPRMTLWYCVMAKFFYAIPCRYAVCKAAKNTGTWRGMACGRSKLSHAYALASSNTEPHFPRVLDRVVRRE